MVPAAPIDPNACGKFEMKSAKGSSKCQTAADCDGKRQRSHAGWCMGNSKCQPPKPKKP